MIGKSKRGPKCHCKDCKHLYYESDGDDYSSWGSWCCNEESERSWAWLHSNSMDGFLRDAELLTVHRCTYFTQRYCSRCGRKSRRVSVFWPGLCGHCDRHESWNLRHQRNWYENRPRRFKKPRYMSTASHTPEFYRRYGNYCRKLKL